MAYFMLVLLLSAVAVLANDILAKKPPISIDMPVASHQIGFPAIGGPNKPIMASCVGHEDCASRFCDNGSCAPKKCNNDMHCLSAGLMSYYCSAHGFHIFSGECTPKKGKHQSCSRDSQCLSGNCRWIIRICE